MLKFESAIEMFIERRVRFYCCALSQIKLYAHLNQATEVNGGCNLQSPKTHYTEYAFLIRFIYFNKNGKLRHIFQGWKMYLFAHFSSFFEMWHSNGSHKRDGIVRDQSLFERAEHIAHPLPFTFVRLLFHYYKC